MHSEMINVKATLPNQEGLSKNKKKKNLLAPDRLTHYDMIKYINRAGIDEDTKKELLKQVARYPANTMHHFFDNIHEHIKRIHEKRKKKEEE